ncbi:MAG: hypothetical protein GY941_21855 [Planctomycetes bacterium]|nr:hypothetical protein [Planctomycetota bacterium]
MRLDRFFIVYGVIVVLTLGCYIGNVIRLSRCDFEPSYKAEILYGIGLVSPTFYVSAFVSIDD